MLIDTNEILYRIYKALNLSIEEMLEAYHLEAYTMSKEHLARLLTKRQDKDFMLCSYEELGFFLDGLISLKRGKLEKPSIDEEIEINNNLILKKLRVALKFKEAQTEIVFGLADVVLTKQQLSSLFRKEGHKNFKPCSNALLLSFLEGLDEYYFVGNTQEE